MLNNWVGMVLSGIVVFGAVGYIIYCHISMSHLEGGRFSWEYKDKESAKRADEWRQHCWDEIEREKRAKKRREKARRYWEGYDDDDDD